MAVGTLLAGSLVFAQSAYADVTFTVSGVVHCHGGAVEGVWIDTSTGRGSNFANVYSFKTGKNDGSSSDVRYTRSFTVTSLPVKVTFHIGCGGSTSTWKTVNYSPWFEVKASRILNLFCGNDRTPGPCSFPATGQTTTYNLGEHLQCTEGALNSFHAYDGIWPKWSGNASAWPTKAKEYGWTVTTIPMPKSIVVTSTSGAGHAMWVDRLNTNSAGAVVGLHVYEENYDGSASAPTGHTRWNDIPLGWYYYIPAPSPH